MGYIKVSWPDNQKYSALTDEEFEQYEEDGIIVFCDEGDYLIDEDYIDEIDDVCDARKASLEKIAATAIELGAGDIELRNLLKLPSRDDNVYGFYGYENWVYLLTCEGRDVDPLDVEPEFLEKFIEAVDC